MKDKKSSESRRKLLKSIVAGSGAVVAGKSLPESWGKPVVDSVILPAHAETSPIPYWGLNVPGVGVGDIGPPSGGIHACVEVIGGMATVTFQGSENNLRRSGTVPLDGTPGDASVVASAPGCSNRGGTKQVLIVSYSPGVSITFGVRNSTFSGDPSNSGFNVTILQGACGTFPTLDGTCNP
jgi:hypothetical protein